MLNKIHRLRSVGMDNGIATGFGILYVAEEAYPLIPDEDPAIVLTTGKIPEYDGYELVCRIRPIPDVVQMTLNDDGEVMA